MSEALRLEGVAKTYPGAVGVSVLAGADLTLAAGELVALIAPSGAGKSTLLHIAGLLDQPDTGRVHIAGQDMTDRSDRRRTEARRAQIRALFEACGEVVNHVHVAVDRDSREGDQVREDLFDGL